MTADGGLVVREALGPVDLVVYGLADNRIEALLDPLSWSKIPGCDLNPVLAVEQPFRFVDLKYELVSEFQSFQPSVEVARGCAMGCSFCDEADRPLTPLRAPDEVARSVERTVVTYGADDITPYFEASLFRPPLHWALRVAELIGGKYPLLRWRCSTRADAVKPKL